MHCDPRALATVYFPVSMVFCVGCASLDTERDGVRSIADRHLDCAGDAVAVHVDNEDLSVRHWIASCNYQSVRITCSQDRCNNEVEWVPLLCDSPPEFFRAPDAGNTAAASSNTVANSPALTK